MECAVVPLFPHPSGCRCGRPSLACDGGTSTPEAVVRTAVERAVFGGETGRRRMIQLVGAGALAGAMDRAFPILRAQEAWAETPGPLEKKDLKIGFIAITCATPIILAAPMGFYARQGLNVDVVRTAG